MEKINPTGVTSEEIAAATARNTLVCVTDQMACERIIKAGKAIAEMTHTPLLVLSVLSPQYPQNPDALQYLYDVSKQNNAVMTVRYGDNPAREISRFIKDEKIHYLLSGVPQGEDSILHRIWNRFSSINFFTVATDGEIRQVGPSEQIA